MHKEIKKILVLAGGDDQIMLIKELRLRFVGSEIILIDKANQTLATKHADKHLRISTLDKDEVLKAAKIENVDLIITACGDQTLPSMAYVSEKLGLSCYLTYQQSIIFTNKLYMKKLMIENGIPTSKFLLINSFDQNQEIDLTYPLVVKPVDNNGSKGVKKIHSKSELKNAIEDALCFTRSQNVIIEEYQSGEEYSIEAFIQDAKPYIIIITRLTKIKHNSDKFTIIKCSYPCNLSKVIEQKIKSIVSQIGRAFDINNVPLMIQLIIDGNNISVVEFSARTGGGSKHHFIKKLSGINIFQNLLDITMGLTPDLNLHNIHKYASIGYIYTRPGIFSGILNLDFLKHQGVIYDYFFYKLIGTPITKADTSSDRPAGFFIIANSEAELNEKFFVIDNTVKVMNENNEDIMIHGLYN